MLPKSRRVRARPLEQWRSSGGNGSEGHGKGAAAQPPGFAAVEISLQVRTEDRSVGSCRQCGSPDGRRCVRSHRREVRRRSRRDCIRRGEDSRGAGGGDPGQPHPLVRLPPTAQTFEGCENRGTGQPEFSLPAIWCLLLRFRNRIGSLPPCGGGSDGPREVRGVKSSWPWNLQNLTQHLAVAGFNQLWKSGQICFLVDSMPWLTW
jgi:hypothetical protein